MCGNICCGGISGLSSIAVQMLPVPASSLNTSGLLGDDIVWNLVFCRT